jgi:hypothetical protein
MFTLDESMAHDAVLKSEHIYGEIVVHGDHPPDDWIGPYSYGTHVPQWWGSTTACVWHVKRPYPWRR